MSAQSDFLYSCIIPFFQDDPATGYYTKYQQGTYDPATSEYTNIPVEIPCSLLLLDLTRNNNGLSSVFGTEILAGDKECWMLPPEKADNTILPLVIDTTSDRLRVGNITYKIVTMKEANPTGANPIAYQFMLRR